MLDNERNAIRSNFDKLAKNTANLPELVVILMVRGLLSENEKDFINSQLTDFEKANTLYMKLMRNGERNAFEILVECLRGSGNVGLADLLRPPNPAAPAPHPEPGTGQIVTQRDNGSANARQPPPVSLSTAVDFVDNATPLAVNVRPRPAQQTASVYKLDTKPRGFVLIINNYQFSMDETRAGAQIDETSMEKLFQQLEFEVHVERDVHSDTLQDKIKRFQQNFKETEVDSCFVIVMSHGEAGTIKMSDSTSVNILSDIVYKFDHENCPQLKGKPKVFIFQACQQFRTCTDSSRGPEMEDTLLCFSTIPGTYANRDVYLGSWYIYCLTKVFMERALQSDEIREMLEMVYSELKNARTECGTQQRSSYQSIGFTKKFIFN